MSAPHHPHLPHTVSPTNEVSEFDKHEAEHDEKLGIDDDAAAVYHMGDGLLKSRFDELSIPRTLWIFRRSVLVVLAVYTGYMCEGFELGAGGSIVANEGFIKQFGDGGSGVTALSPTWLSAWGASINVGQILTFTYISWFADRFGRRYSFYLAFLWFVLGLIFMNVARSPAVWLLAKLCSGAGIGILQIVCQVYVMEIAPNRIRGGLLLFNGVWSNVGSIIVSLMMQQLNKKHPLDYLLAMRILWAPIGFTGLCWAFIPESPWFHARRDNKEYALKAMRQLYGNVYGYDYEEEYAIIATTIHHERTVLQHKPTIADIFRGGNLRRTMIVMLVSVTNQLGGLAVIATYSTYFFSLAGLADPFLGSLILSCVNLGAVVIWCVCTDKLGRRSFLLPAQMLLCLVLFTIGGLHWSGATSGAVGPGTALLVMCCIWSCCYMIIAMSSVVYSAEMPSALLRIRTGPVTFLANSLLGISTTFATPPMLLALGLRTAFVFGAFSVPICILMWIYVPETKGRSAGEIDELFEKKVPAWRWSRHVTDAETQMRASADVRGHMNKSVHA